METKDIAAGHDTPHQGLVTILVNDNPVKILGHSATGREIKVAAIEQGVAIELGFELLEHLGEGETRVVADHERVQLHEHLKFTAHAHHREIVVTVNEQPVKMEGHRATGAQIKTAAIAQGVHIQPNFVLQEELPNGTSKLIGDQDVVHLREHLRFTAIAPDDNS
jgi:hypothetical protein